MEILTTAFVAFAITTLTTPLAIKIAKRFDLVDDPARRPHPAHIHVTVIPRAGGLGIYVAILVTSLIFLPIEKYLVGIFGGITTLLVIGLIDDKYTKFSPYLRLALLILAAAFPVMAGIGISYVTNPIPQFIPGNIIRLDTWTLPFELFGPHKIIVIADLLALIWIIALTQIINWSKGVDGQMPSITAIAALTLGFLSLELYNQGDLNQLNVARLSFITFGASLGFLIFNWHPAKIIPGFSGSTVLAFMLAILAILSGAKLATALIVLAIPTVDFVYTFFRRIVQGKSPVWGDRGHLHHHLLDKGWSPQKISLFYLCVSAMLGAGALLIDESSKVFLLLGSVAAAFSLILWANSFGGLLNRRGRDSG